MRKKGFLTIGYGNMGLSNFISTIRSFRINCIVDVRTRPYSKYNIAFNKEELRARLNEDNLSYFWLGNKLGGRYDKISLCDMQGVVDYEKVAKSEKFKEGIIELLKLCDKYNVCIMCSEQDPLKCHRFLLICRTLKEYNIYHILPSLKLIKNSELEENLFKMSADLNQLSIFSEENEESFENKAYKRQNIKTAYVSQKVKDLLSQGITEDIPEKIKLFTISCSGKTAEDFFTLLKEYHVKRVIDLRVDNKSSIPLFAAYPDIGYYCRISQIEYERKENLIPLLAVVNDMYIGKINQTEFLRIYLNMLYKRKAIIELISEDLDKTCFLYDEKDYKKSYCYVIIKALKKENKNIIVRHLK